MAKRPDPVAPPVKSEDHAKILERAMERVTLGEKGHTDECLAMVENYRAWQALPHKNAPRKEPWQSDFRNPYIQNHIRTLTSRTTDPRPSMEYTPTMRVPPQTIKLVEKANDHFSWLDNLMVTQGRSMLQVAIFGQAWTQSSWLYRTQNRKVSSSLQEMMNGAEAFRTESMVLDDRYHHALCHPFDVLRDPVANTLEECRFLVHRAYLAPAQVKAKRRHYKGDKLCGQYDNTDAEQIRQGGGRNRDVDLPNQFPEIHEARRDGNVEILTVWDRERNTRTVIANRAVVLLHGPMPYRHGDLPFSCVITTPDVMRLGGLSEVGKMAAAQAYTHLLENQILDNTRLSMDFILLVRDTIENIEDLKIGPGEVWPVRDPASDVRPLQNPQQQMVGIDHIRDMRSQMQDMIGLSPFASGADPTSSGTTDNRTAFGIGSVIEEGNKSVTNKLAFARALGIERMYQQGLELMQQYLTTPTLIAMGEDPQYWPQVTHRDMPGRYLVRNRAITDELNKQSKIGNAQTLLMALQPWMGTPIPTRSGQMMVDPTPAFELLGQGIEVESDRFMVPMQVPDPMQPQTTPGGVLPGETQATGYEAAGA